VIVLGVDPGTAITGYGVVEESEGQLRAIEYGVITTPAGDPLPRRLQTIYRELGHLAALHQPTSGSVEKLYFSRNVRTAMSVGQARGVALLALADAGLDIREYTPTEVKQSVSGYGGADKGQVQQMVQALLNLAELPRPDDAADALAVAICHIHAMRLEELLDR
jgi:crossover junction endodeoxyribonuclease RuvC